MFTFKILQPGNTFRFQIFCLHFKVYVLIPKLYVYIPKCGDYTQFQVKYLCTKYLACIPVSTVTLQLKIWMCSPSCVLQFQPLLLSKSGTTFTNKSFIVLPLLMKYFCRHFFLDFFPIVLFFFVVLLVLLLLSHSLSLFPSSMTSQNVSYI